MARVQILLATYNGAEFLEAQLRSLEKQSYSDIEVLCSDDGSSDATLDIIEQFSSQSLLSIRLLPAMRSGGAAANFFRLIQASTAPYLMLCDQDDVWQAGKIQRLLDEVLVLEKAHPHREILVHSDLTVVDRKLRPIASSLFEHQNIPKERSFAGYLIQNNVTGCSTMFNRALVERLRLPAAGEVIMHDWWLALVAAAFGVIRFVDTPLTRYRQHGGNTIGAKRWNLAFIVRKAFDLLHRGRSKFQIEQQTIQAAAFERLYADCMQAFDRDAAHFLAHLREHSALARRAGLIRHRLMKHGWIRNLALMLIV